MSVPRRRERRAFSPEHYLYQSYSTEEDARRTNLHYEQPTQFFALITGGEWNVYSCNLWPPSAQTDSDSQVAKLDLLAELLDLKPGQRILDVGCGWGGPLVYLCKTYGVTGVGLTLSPSQKRVADERVDRYGIDIQIVEGHWRAYETQGDFHAILTDEVIVHFNDLEGFFAKAYSWLRPEGRMLNKELHFTHRSYGRQMGPATSFVNEIYGTTGNYRTLAEELMLGDEAGFELEKVYQIPNEQYQKTMTRWLANMDEHRSDLEALVGPVYFRRFYTYLKIARRYMIGGHMMTLDVVVSRKPAGV